MDVEAGTATSKKNAQAPIKMVGRRAWSPGISGPATARKIPRCSVGVSVRAFSNFSVIIYNY